MRSLWIAAALGLLATGALAQGIIIPHPAPNFHERLNSCVTEWQSIPVAARGAMTYRQFTTKCLEGKTARPANAVAACRNGVTAPATAPEGACAYDGGVERWLD